MKKIKTNLNRKFTYWYIKRGYTFEYDELMNPVWKCPWWVRPLLIFFSPSIYLMCKCGEIFCESFKKSLREASVALDEATKAMNEFAEQIKKNKENQAGIDI